MAGAAGAGAAPRAGRAVLAPAAGESRAASPRRGLMLAGSVFVTSMCAVSFVVGRIVFGRVREALCRLDDDGQG